MPLLSNTAAIFGKEVRTEFRSRKLLSSPIVCVFCWQPGHRHTRHRGGSHFDAGSLAGDAVTRAFAATPGSDSGGQHRGDRWIAVARSVHAMEGNRIFGGI